MNNTHAELMYDTTLGIQPQQSYVYVDDKNSLLIIYKKKNSLFKQLYLYVYS